MTILSGITDQGLEVPVQVDSAGRLVAQPLPGTTGPAGPQGPAGAAGAEGAAGAAGANGNDGAAGPQGPQGPQGPTGPQGPQGEQGPAGPAGSGGSFETKVKLSANFVATGATQIEVPEFTFTCDANSHYFFELFCMTSCYNTLGFDLGLQFPSGYTQAYGFGKLLGYGTSYEFLIVADGNVVRFQPGSNAESYHAVYVKGWVRTGSAGLMRTNWGTVSGNGSPATTLYKGSSLTYWKG